MSERSARSARGQLRDSVRRHARDDGAVDFFNVLTGPGLLETAELHMGEHRERLYPPTVTLSMFIKQALDADGSCQKAVNGWAAQRMAEGLSMHSVRTGGYCRARQRLPLTMVSALTRETGDLLCSQSPKRWRWRDRRVKLVDGTGISMPDTPENQQRYPQPSSQKPGVGFPQLRLVAMVCLSSGAVIDAAHGPMAGKGNSEHALIRKLTPTVDPGDVVLGDALYCSYWLVATLHGRGADVLFQQNGARRTDFRRGRRLATRDHVVSWTKPEQRPSWMTRQDYESYPPTLTVRELEVDGRVLVTTMCDRRRSSKKALSELYTQRWHVELDLRNIKTTLGMDVLRCLTPDMAERELWVHLLAYNLIRVLMAQAALNSGLLPRELSFKHASQMWLQWLPVHVHGAEPAQVLAMIGLVTQIRVGNRPGRIEPRARKRRPKPYPWLKVPRHTARRQIRTLGCLPNG